MASVTAVAVHPWVNVSRPVTSQQTFNELYDDKLASFLGALDRHLGTITDRAAFARLFVVEVYAAGPEAMPRRDAVQAQIVDGLAGLLDANTEAQRFACRSFVAAVSSLVTLPVVSGDKAGLEALRRPLRNLLPTFAS